MKVYIEVLFTERKPEKSGYYFVRYDTTRPWPDDRRDYFDADTGMFEDDFCYVWLEEIDFPSEKQIVELAHNRFMTSEYISPEASRIYQICYQNCWEWIRNYIQNHETRR